MIQKEKENLESLCLQSVAYVGAANYAEREIHAKWNVSKAFEDFDKGREIKWVEQTDD